MAEVEYLIRQSIQGFHLLFETQDIREIYEDSQIHDFSEELAYSVEHHLERLIQSPTLSRKKAYLESLDRKTYELVIRTYFNIVENNMLEARAIHH